MPNNFKLQQENGIVIESWVGNQKDTALKDLATILIGNFYSDVANSRQDVRISIREYKEKIAGKKRTSVC